MLLVFCTVDEVVRFLKRVAYIRCDEKDVAFEIGANHFRDFAIEDSKIDSVYHRVNALSNVKRAIDCRIDELLYGLCLHIKSESEKWNFPKKIQVLGDLGILAPRILQKINRKRNQLEHQYIEPTREDVEDAVDVATLFLGYTDRLYNYVCHLVKIYCEPKTVIAINRKDGTIVVKEDNSVRKLKIGNKDGWFEVAKIIVVGSEAWERVPF